MDFSGVRYGTDGPYGNHGVGGPAVGTVSEDAGACPAGEDDGICPGGIWEKLARIISFVLNPLVMPVYSILLLLYGRTVMYFLPVRTKLFFLFAVLLNTFIVPVLFIGFLKTTGYVKSFDLNDKRDRVLPLIVTAFCYAVCAYMVKNLMVAFIVKRILVSATVCVLCAAGVSFFWKISLHMIAAGGGLAILILITISKIGFLQPWIIALVVSSGFLASARLYLGKHNPAQVAGGFFLGFAVSGSVMLLG